MKPLDLFFATMTPYDPTYTGVHVLFPKENVPDTIGEWVSKQGLKQLRIAETEKYAHVTFFLNGGRESLKVKNAFWCRAPRWRLTICSLK